MFEFPSLKELLDKKQMHINRLNQAQSPEFTSYKTKNPRLYYIPG